MEASAHGGGENGLIGRLTGRDLLYFRLVLHLLLDEKSLSHRDLQGEGDDEGVHFVELAVVRAVDHAVPEYLHPLAEVLEECGVDHFLIAN